MEYPCPQYEPPVISDEAIAAMLASLTSGAKVVQYGDKRIEYQNADHMWKIFRWMQAMRNPCAGIGGQNRVIADFNNGLQRRFADYETEEFRNY